MGPESAQTILMIPPLFAEHNLMRRQIILIMRHLADAGVASALPDLPGWNESTLPLQSQTLSGWRASVIGALNHFGAETVLAVRSGALLVPSQARGWVYEQQSGQKMLRGMIRAQLLADREAGSTQSSEQMAEEGRAQGVVLNGWKLNGTLFRELEGAAPPESPHLEQITQSGLSGAGLWLRAEPDENNAQAVEIAEIVSAAMAGNAGPPA